MLDSMAYPEKLKSIFALLRAVKILAMSFNVKSMVCLQSMEINKGKVEISKIIEPIIKIKPYPKYAIINPAAIGDNTVDIIDKIARVESCPPTFHSSLYYKKIGDCGEN